MEVSNVEKNTDIRFPKVNTLFTINRKNELESTYGIELYINRIVRSYRGAVLWLRFILRHLHR